MNSLSTSCGNDSSNSHAKPFSAMIVMVIYGVVRDGTTSRRGITRPILIANCELRIADLFWISISNQQSAFSNGSDPVSVADGLDLCGARGGGGRRRSTDAVDDTPEIAVADRLAVLAERDDGAV